jgi:hypothetical protein
VSLTPVLELCPLLNLGELGPLVGVELLPGDRVGIRGMKRERRSLRRRALSDRPP